MPGFLVNGVVSQKDGQLYIQLSNDEGMIGQFTMAQARVIAMDILGMAARTEADAMILKFFRKEKAPDALAVEVLTGFRDFRAELDQEKVDRGLSDPETGEERT